MKDFMYIFNEAMHKLNLIGVKLSSKNKNRSGRVFYKFIGKFEFVYPIFFDNKKI